MLDAAPYSPHSEIKRISGPAEVLEVHEDGRRIRVRPHDICAPVAEAWARIALPIPHAWSEGDEVLLTSDDLGDVYVIGLLEAARKSPCPSAPCRLALPDGAHASVGAGRELNVYSPRGELIFSYDAREEKARVVVESGDIEFSAKRGNICLEAAGEVRIGARRLKLEATSEVELSARDKSALRLSPKTASLSGPTLEVNAERGEFQIEDTHYRGRKFLANFRYGKLVIQRMERLAKTVVEKASDVFQSVKNLSQLKAGRVRTLVDSTYQLKSKKTRMKAEEDFKVDAESIHLG